jgi:hypothetical protein
LLDNCYCYLIFRPWNGERVHVTPSIHGVKFPVDKVKN